MRRKKVMVVILCALLLFGALAIADVSLGQQKALAYEATFYSTTADGQVWGSNTSYITAHITANSVADFYDTLFIGQKYVSRIYSIYRSAVFFDTSSLPDDVDITSATLSLYGWADGSQTDFDITVVEGSSLVPPLALSDYGLLRGQTISGGAFNTAGFSTSGYNDIQLNAAGMGWISKTGMTKFGLRSSLDIDIDDPTGYEDVAVISSDYGGGSDFYPKLVVTYEYPPTSVPTLSQWGMIGMAIVLVAALVWSVRRRWVVSTDKS
jgi:hypothetical protein